MTRNHDELTSLAEGYVLGSLSDAERRDFESHAAGCADCTRLVRELTAVGEAMARGVPQHAPPPGLRDRVIARAIGSAVAQGATAGKQVQPSRTAVAAWLAAAAVIVAAIMSVAAWQYRQEAQRARADYLAATVRTRTLEQQVAQLQADAATAARTGAVLSATDLARVELAGQPPAPGAAGRVFWSPTHGLVFAATNLPALPPGRVYQLWIVADAPISAGIARPGNPGDFNVVTVTAAPKDRAKAFAVTIEPEGGQPAPTGPMFLLGSF
jgi:anti-sigma-K factor RskA